MESEIKKRRIRILVHDRSGHAFPVQLSRALARRGYEIIHSYAAFFQTPKGNLTVQLDDPSTFRVEPIHLDRPFQKYSFVKRYFQELKYAHRLMEQIYECKPDVVLLGQIPPEAQSLIYRRLSNSIRKVFWVQDLYGIAIRKILGKKYGLPGRLIGEYYTWLEKRLLRKSDAVVLITDDFVPILQQWGVSDASSNVIPNWAVLPDVPVRPKDNPWAQHHGITDKFVFTYSGTLGMKHNPELLLRLAQQYRDDPSVRVLVVSQGLGADYLREQKQALELDNLILEPFQPFNVLPEVLGSSDVLIAILEPDAGIFSVPSKVLSYLCARRPILLSVPEENLSAKIVSQQNAGLVVDPTDIAAFLRASRVLYSDPALCNQMGEQARVYAETHFEIERIADQFEAILSTGTTYR